MTLLMRQVRISQRAASTQRMSDPTPLFAGNARAYMWAPLRSNDTPVGYTYRLFHGDGLQSESTTSIPFIYRLWLLVHSLFNNLRLFIVS
jgi:hypothetical protein